MLKDTEGKKNLIRIKKNPKQQNKTKQSKQQQTPTQTHTHTKKPQTTHSYQL